MRINSYQYIIKIINFLDSNKKKLKMKEGANFLKLCINYFFKKYIIKNYYESYSSDIRNVRR